MEVLTIDAMVLMLRAATKTSSEKSGVSDGKAVLIVLRMGRSLDLLISSIRAQPSQHRVGHGKAESVQSAYWLAGLSAYVRLCRSSERHDVIGGLVFDV